MKVCNLYESEVSPDLKSNEHLWEIMNQNVRQSSPLANQNTKQGKVLIYFRRVLENEQGTMKSKTASLKLFSWMFLDNTWCEYM